MRSLILSFFLLSLVICSCRSSSHTVADYSTSAQVDSANIVVSESHDDILYFIESARQLELEDITVEFYPPDTTMPNIRAAPRSLSIKTAKTADTKKAITHQTNDSISVETAASKSSAEESLAYETQSKKSVMRAADWLLMIGFTVGSAVVLFFLRYLRRRL